MEREFVDLSMDHLAHALNVHQDDADGFYNSPVVFVNGEGHDLILAFKYGLGSVIAFTITEESGEDLVKTLQHILKFRKEKAYAV